MFCDANSHKKQRKTAFHKIFLVLFGDFEIKDIKKKYLKRTWK
jgi:uncharacterized protein YhhL (DUF1145 family)